MATIFRLPAACDILITMSPIEVEIDNYEEGEEL